MAVIVLGLSSMPCADDIAADAKAKTEISKSLDHNESEDSDVCSPFCQCACCAGISFQNFYLPISAPHTVAEKSYSSFLPTPLIRFSVSVWQPPRTV
jgi:hypothetical protein